MKMKTKMSMNGGQEKRMKNKESIIKIRTITSFIKTSDNRIIATLSCGHKKDFGYSVSRIIGKKVHCPEC